MRLLGWAARNPGGGQSWQKIFSAPPLPIDLFGLRFPNPVGLAAGMDKSAGALPIWEKLGFGFCELGGVTWHPQPGNPKPRIFRAIEDEALVNRMGFNNPGAEAMAAILATWKKSGQWPSHPVGINLGKSKITPLEKAANDYARSFAALRNLADFFVVNVSSPNTPNLRRLQDRTALDEILAAIQERNGRPDTAFKSGTNSATAVPRPVLVKIAPDLAFEAVDEILELAAKRSLAGIIATNTSIDRPRVDGSGCQKIYCESGGLSGRPLRHRSTEMIRHVYRQSKGVLPIIGVGGIFEASDALAKIFAGASLLQIYTGLIYQGPTVAREIVRGLAAELSRRGYSSLNEAVGAGSRW